MRPVPRRFQIRRVAQQADLVLQLDGRAANDLESLSFSADGNVGRRRESEVASRRTADCARHRGGSGSRPETPRVLHSRDRFLHVAHESSELSVDGRSHRSRRPIAHGTRRGTRSPSRDDRVSASLNQSRDRAVFVAVPAWFAERCESDGRNDRGGPFRKSRPRPRRKRRLVPASGLRSGDNAAPVEGAGRTEAAAEQVL